MATVKIGRKGFGQVEPNHLSGIVTGQILAQLPVDTATMGDIIENGRFAGTVRTDKSVYLIFLYIKVDMLCGFKSAERNSEVFGSENCIAHQF